MGSARVVESPPSSGASGGGGKAARVTVASPSPSHTAAAAHTADASSFWKRAALLVACALGIYATFLGYGILQERMSTHEYGANKERFNFFLFLVFFQCIGNAAFAVVLGLFTPRRAEPASDVPASAYFLMSASYVGAMYSSNLALAYMSYPAQALAKSCKLIPVMLSRFLLMREVRYTRREVMQVVAITAGICVFMLGAEGGGKHGKKTRETSWLGLALCILSLALDGYTGPAQERLNKAHKLSMSTMMFYLNAWAALLVAVGLLVTGEMGPGLAFCTAHPSILPEAALFSLLAASGQALILYTLLQFNSLVVVTVTTTRKFFTILLSVVLYGHAMSTAQWSGVALVFAGLSVDIYAKYAESGGKKHGHGAHGEKTAAANGHADSAKTQ